MLRLGPHPDDVVGVLASLGQLLVPASLNTIPDLEAYAGVSPERLFPAPGPPPDVRRKRRWGILGLKSEYVWFRSLHEPIEPNFRNRYRREYREAHTVWARRIRPPGSRERPRLLYLHGYMQPETPVEELGLLSSLALRLNVEVIQVQFPYHGRRKPKDSLLDGDLYWTADLVRSLESLRQSVIDARTALSWLLDDDPRPVGVCGLSLGGALSAVLTCVDERFAYSLPLIAHMDVGALTADAPVLGRMRRELRAFGWRPEDLGAFLERLGWNELLPKISPERIVLFAASEDRFFRPELVESMWRSWGEPRIEWYPCSHMGFLSYLPGATSVMRSLVDEIAERRSA